MLVKKYMKLKKMNLMNPPTKAITNFLLKLLIFRTPYILTKAGMKTLNGQRLNPRMGLLFHTKLIPELNLTLLL